MPVLVGAPLFLLAACVSLATSWLLVSRLERVGERLGLSEALLGMVAALAADAPEITSAVTALLTHQQRVGAGVVIGSNVFNLAALLGLGALVAGGLRFRRRVVVLGGSVAMFVAVVCLATVLGWIPAWMGLGLAAIAMLDYMALLGVNRSGLRRLAARSRWGHWLRAAVVEEERDLDAAIRPRRARRGDVVTAMLALIVVVALIALGWRRLGAPYNTYAVLALTFALCNPATGEPLLSLPRLVLVVFPLFVALAARTERRPVVRALLVGVCLVGLAWLTARFVIFAWVA